MAKKEKHFDENSKLGFMRFIQVYNIFSIFAVLIVLLFIRGSWVTFDFEVITNVILILSQAMVIWLIARRKMYTREIVVALEIFEIFVLAITDFLHGNFTIGNFIGNSIPPLIVMLYFITSPRAKAVLVQPWNDQSVAEIQEEKNRKLWDPKSGAFWMRMLLYFFAFSIMGHWMEMGIQILVQNGLFPGTLAAPDSLTWRDGLNPFPIYGIAVVICGIALYPVYLWLCKKMSQRWQALVLSFLVNTAFCVIAELLLGFFFNADYHAWDYRDQFMNFQGQICLVYSIAFGIASSVITWYIFPMMENALGDLRRDVFGVIFAVAVVLYILIFVTYNIDPIIDIEKLAEENGQTTSALIDSSNTSTSTSASSSELPQAA